MWDGAGLDEQLDLAHKPESGILLCIPRAVVIQLADTAELLDDDAVNLVFAFCRADRVGAYLVLLADVYKRQPECQRRDVPLRRSEGTEIPGMDGRSLQGLGALRGVRQRDVYKRQLSGGEAPL